ncbi:MFS transporter [Pseudofrancisella aestuarii]|uniref:MFS transporter n=1 Tax=Pseudofrancisella aestuarii TaxID=2670347 RepID=A0ABV9T9P3_9GAMM|nr:MFS transporter [Pseudofrancisella aestuarii]
MKKTLLLILTPIIAMCVLSFGNGFFTTFSTIELNSMGHSHIAIGIISAAYFLGLTAGPYFSQYTIVRVGYIRAFSLFASTMAISTLLLGIFKGMLVWMILRFICGYSLAALFVIVESWCLLSTDKKSRGTIFSIYLFIYYGTQAFSQLMLNFHFSDLLLAYCFVSTLCSVAIVFMCFTKTVAPAPASEEVNSPMKIIKAVPLGMVAGFTGGVLLGSVYSMLPLFLINISNDHNTVSIIMMTTLLGGMLLQIPIGKISDMIDRRVVMLIVSIGLVIASLLVCIFYHVLPIFIVIMFLFGGGAFVIYPLAISHSSDFLDEDQILSAIGLITIFYGLGSIFGPIIISIFTDIIGSIGFFITVGSASTLLSLYIIYRLRVRSKSSQEETSQFTLVTPESATFSEAQEIVSDRLVES